ncbi:MAG: G8 domain-containing protein [Chitinophagaceae bacterium]
MKRILLLLAFLAGQLHLLAQTITSAQSGNWNNTATWTGGVVPGASNDVVIDAGHTVTFNVSSATINALTVNAGGIFIVSPSNTLTITTNTLNDGTINNNSAGGLRTGGSFANNGTITGAVNSVLIVGGAQLQNNGSLQSSFLYFSTATLGISNTAATVSGTGSFTLATIIMLKSASANVTSTVPISLSAGINLGGGGGKFVLVNGDLQTNNIVGGSANIYIITSGTGKLIYSGGTSPKILHVGTFTSYSPVTISNGNVSTHSFGIRVTDAITGSPGSAVVNRQWEINDINGGANADLTFQWTGAIESGTFNRASSAIARYDGSNWQPITTYTSASGSNPYTRTVTGVTGFAQFIIGSSGAFPVTSAQSGNWSTASTWAGGIVPTATDNVIIASGHTITYDVASGSANSLVVNNSATLQLNASMLLSVAANASNSGTINLGSSANLRIGGDLTNGSVIAPAMGAANTLISIGSNFSNTGSFTSQLLYLSNTSLAANANAATISGNSIISINTLNVLKSGANVTVNVNLGMVNLNLAGTSGNIILSANNLTVSGSISGYSPLKYIQTNGAGVLTFMGAASPKVFPVGNATYTPLTISNGNVSTHNFSVRVSSAFSSPPLNNSVVNKEWNIHDLNGGGSADLTFQWNAADEDPSFNRTVCYAGHFNGTAWVPVSANAPASGTDPYTRTVTGISSFSPFAIGSNGALPVSLIDFTASKIPGGIKLEWTAENEIGFSHYEMEKSNDGRNYGKIKTIAVSTGSGIKKYSMNDSFSSGMQYYRLKMIDLDGSFKYSRVVRIDAGKKLTVAVYPNPAKNIIFVQNMNRYETVSIIDFSGRVIRKKNISGNSYLDVADLRPGTYMLKLDAREDQQSIPFIRQ